MLNYDELYKAVLKHKLSASMLREIARRLNGKSDEEKNRISIELAKEIEETCPLREEAVPR